MRSRIASTLAALLAACLCGAAVAAAQPQAEDPAPPVAKAPLWDQEKVAALASRVVDALDALLSDPQIDAPQATAVQQREHEAAIATARQRRGFALMSWPSGCR